jgi:TctA family transporter
MTKINAFIQNLPTLWAQLDFGICIILMIVYFIFDILYAKYILSVSKLRAVRSANLSSLLQILSVIGTIYYVDNVLYTVPIIIGIWTGTYLSLKIAFNKKGKIKGKKGKK